MKTFRRYLFSLAIFCAYLPAAGFEPGLVLFSGGSWVVMPPEKSPTYFNKLSVSWYTTLLGWKVVSALPVAWTVEGEGGRQRLFLGDGSLYVGRRFGNFEPRAGILAPLGYGISPSWKSEAWIGSNNLRAQAGLSFGRADESLEGIPITAEIMVSTPLTHDNAFARRGSVSALSFVKAYLRANENIRYGLDIFLSAHRTIWSWTWEKYPGQYEHVVETGGGIVPNVWFEHRISRIWSWSLKAGFGPQFKKSNQAPQVRHAGNSLNLSAGLQWYP